MNADCQGEIIAGRTSFSLLAKSFAMHLYVVLQQEIGLKSFMEVGFWPLGTRAIAVALVPERLCPLWKKA